MGNFFFPLHISVINPFFLTWSNFKILHLKNERITYNRISPLFRLLLTNFYNKSTLFDNFKYVDHKKLSKKLIYYYWF